MNARIRRWIGWAFLVVAAAGSSLPAAPTVHDAGAAGYPDADAVVLHEEVAVSFQADGSYEQSVYRRVKILTEAGKRKYASDSFAYHRQYGTVDIQSAQLVKPDGSAHPVSESQITDATLREARQPAPPDEDFRRKTIRYPALEVQDILETRVLIRVSGMLRGHYTDFFLFQLESPVLFKRVEIRGPATRPLRFAVRSGLLEHETVASPDGSVLHRWTGRDMPAIRPEPGMEALPGVATRLIVSTFADWEELSRYGHALDEGKIDAGEALRQKVVELTGGLADEHSRIMAIFRFVSTEIRYSLESMDLGAFMAPRAASEVLEKKTAYGREKTVLLIAMLREIGIEAVVALVNVSRSTDPEIPTVYFERAVCAVRMPDGRQVFMDPTLELSTSVGEPYLGDRDVLLLTPSGDGLFRVPHSPAGRSLGRIQAATRLKPDLGLESHLRIEGTGLYDFILRTLGRQSQGPQLAQFWQQLAAAFHPGSRVRDVQVSAPADLATPFRIAFDLSSPGYALEAGRFVLFRMPLSTNYFELYSLGLPRLAEPEERRYPLSLFSTLAVRQEERLELPDGFDVVALPDPLEIASGPMRLRLVVLREGRQLVFLGEFACETSMLQPAEYPGLRRLLRDWEKSRKSMVILERAPGKGGRP